MADQQMMTEKESLEVISKMIAKAKHSYHETGLGPILWGVIVTFCSLVTWAELHYDFDLGFDVWLLTLIAVLPTIYFSVKQGKRKPIKTYDDTAMDYAWGCFGVAMFLVIHNNMQVNESFMQLKNEVEKLSGAKPEMYFSDFAPGYLIILYGMPTLITGGIKNFKPMIWGGIICWMAAVISAYVSREWDMLLMALSATCAWLIPGIILYSRFRKLRNANNV